MKAPPSQDILEIEEIREGVIILKDGTLRAVLMAAGINFALRSEEEKEAIIYGFQDFLNALDFPIQFIIQSRKVDAKEYLAELARHEEHAPNDLMRLQISEYIKFIRDLVGSTNIMEKAFYLVIPFDPRIGTKAERAIGSLGFVKNYFGAKKAVKFDSQKFIIYKDQLLERARFVQINLRRIEVNSVILETEALLELFWTLYNPGEGGAPTLPQEIEGVQFEKY